MNGREFSSQTNEAVWRGLACTEEALERPHAPAVLPFSTSTFFCPVRESETFGGILLGFQSFKFSCAMLVNPG